MSHIDVTSVTPVLDRSRDGILYEPFREAAHANPDIDNKTAFAFTSASPGSPVSELHY